MTSDDHDRILEELELARGALELIVRDHRSGMLATVGWSRACKLAEEVLQEIRETD